MKKILAVLLSLLLLLSLCACAEQEHTALEDGVIRVAMITDHGDITDRSFNQNTYEACRDYCAAHGLDFKYFKPVTDTDEDRVAMIDAAVDEDYNVIVTPGYTFATSLKNTVADYPDTTFVAIDVARAEFGEKYRLPENLTSFVYQEQLVGYMAGYAAVKMGYEKLAYLGGMAGANVTRFGYGYLQGIAAAAKELGKTDVEVKYAYGNQFYGDADITSAMDTWYAGGTELVFACGGNIYTSVAEAAQRYGGKIIGVDVDQKESIDSVYGEGITVTSAEKSISATVNYAMDRILADEFDQISGEIRTVGLVSEKPEDNFVRLSETTQFCESFTREDYEALVADLYHGRIMVSDDVTIKPADVTDGIRIIDLGNLK